ncbi:MAG: bacteriohopanetetrol glucosamine biosynthesis glycosyltransferase HpnI [Acidobacteria bacterium]|nr:bacteriohopanetetrol glucosamine biosynthesis glycosyltransferase HpnI [Acidobacteriota bacterium]
MSVLLNPMFAASVVWRVLFAFALVGTVSALVFLALALIAAVRYRKTAREEAALAAAVAAADLPPVTIFKPVHGAEPRLSQNLESFFRQDYPDFEIIFGAREAADPALQVVEDLRRRFPAVKCKIVLSGPPQWPNAKVYSLDKMIAQSANDYFIISDSDVKVEADFLRHVVPPLLNPKNGLVTCMYRGIPENSFTSLLEAMGMSVEMSSGVMVADMLEGMRFALGPVMATRRDAVEKIGGIVATSEYYSDDFVLGNLIWAAGYRVVLSHVAVDHVLALQSFVRTFGHQRRWMTSTRYSRPWGHMGTGLTFAMPFGILGWISAMALGHVAWAWAFLLIALLNRIVQSLVVGGEIIQDPRARSLCWLYPLRDLFGFVTWVGSYTSATFNWRGELYRFSKGGKIIPARRAGEHSTVEV